MLRVVIAVLMMVPAQNAWALSCMKHSVEQLYSRTASAKGQYLPAVGAFQFDTNVLPKQTRRTEGQPFQFTATFEGRVYNGRKFANEFKEPVTVAVSCAGPWCGSLRPNWPMMVMLRATPTAFVFEADACASWSLNVPENKQIERFEYCAQTKSCR